MTLKIGEARVSHRDVARVARGELAVALTEQPSWHERMAKDRAAVESRVASGEPFYGVNTGFGASVVNAVASEYSANLVANLYRFHGVGVGPKLSREESRAVIVTRLAQLAAGWSGIRAETLRAMVELLVHDIIPVIPELGSVGASGDLTPMSYLAAVLSGEREVFGAPTGVDSCGHIVRSSAPNPTGVDFPGPSVRPAAEALATAGLAPITLRHKEALSIMNGTSVMTALVSLALDRTEAFARGHALVTSWNSFLLRGQAAHIDERLFLAKPHPGSVRYAAWVRTGLASPAQPALTPGKVQDPYSIRCAPHVVGVLLEILDQAATTIEIELNGAGDNPLMDQATGIALHGGNFYGSHVTHIADTLKLHLAHAAEIIERQLVLLCHSTKSSGIPENLVAVSGPSQTSHHGFKAVEILASSLVAEAMKLASPASVFSRSTEGHNQDKVPMGPIAARDLRSIQVLADHTLVIGLLAAAQATDATNRSTELPPPLRSLYTAIRKTCSATMHDRRHDILIAQCLADFHGGQLPI